MADLAAFERSYTDRARVAVAAAAAGGAWLGVDSGPRDGTAVAGWWRPATGGAGVVVLPNPWDERSAIAPMELQCWSVTERVVTRLAPALDGIHGVAHGPAWWHRVLAPWLLHVVSAIADRRLFIRTCAELGLPLLSADGAGAAADVAATMTDGVSGLRDRRRCASMLAGIAAELGLEVAAVTPREQDAPAGERQERPGGGRAAAVVRDPLLAFDHVREAAVARRAQRLLLREPAQVAIVGHSGLRDGDLLDLGRRVGGLRHVASVPCPSDIPVAAPTQRAALPQPGGADELERLVVALLPRLLPRSVLEGLAPVKAASASGYGPPMPVVACNYAADEVQNVFLAECEAAGHTVVHAQHGGFYLQAAVNAQERLELRPGSEFWSWGASGPGIVPTPSPRLERVRGTARGGSCITLIEGLHPPDTQVLRFASTPLGNQGYDGAERLAAFVEAAADTSRGHMRLKRFPPVLGAGPRPAALARLRSDGPRGARAATAWMRRSRLTVVSYPDTPFLESMVVGGPTIGLWNSAHWEWREELRGVVEGLERVGIVFGDPVQAAAHLDAVLPDLRGWWESPEVASARTTFVDHLARPGDWRAAWAAGLRGIAGTQLSAG